jgi:[ribosomal protein S5]-alanine N-acetyltransferase
MEIILRKNKLPIIKTRRLILREINVDDISLEYIAWMNDPETIKFLDVRFRPPTIKDMREYIQSKLEDVISSMHFGVYDSNGMRLIGTVTLPHINRNHFYAEISFVIGEMSAKGKGYATEAIHGLTYYAFYYSGICMLYSEHLETNKASNRVLLKNGYIDEGRFKKKFIDYNGCRVDSVIKGLYIKDFIPQNKLLGKLPPLIVKEEE